MATVTLKCKNCGTDFDTTYKYRNKRKFCSRTCTNQGQTGSGNPAFGHTYRTKETHPEWAAKVSQTSRERQINSGDKNGMKRPEAVAKMAKTRREKVTPDSAYRANLSEKIRQAWAEGKYEGVRVGQCKWYDHARPDGTVVKLQGTWEVVMARHLDSLGIEYEAHRGRVPYVDAEGGERSYYPDFYVPAFDCFLDVKGAFFDDVQASKVDLIRKCNPGMRLVIVNRQVFSSWGIDVVTESNKFREEEIKHEDVLLVT